MDASVNRADYIKRKAYDVFLWCFRRFCSAIVFVLLLIVHIAKSTFDYICQLIVGGIILYFQLGVILFIVIWGLSWFLGKIGPHH
jgi:hypothetical protein